MPVKKTAQKLTTQQAVARSLGVSARDIRHWREKFSDAPAKVDKKEDLNAWKAFYESHSVELNQSSKESKLSMEKLKLQEQEEKVIRLQKQNRELDQKFAIMSGKFIPRDEVEKQLSPLVAELIVLIKDRDLELSNWAPGRKTGEIRAHQAESRDKMFATIRGEVSAFIESAEAAGKITIASEPTSVNSPGAGRPVNPNSKRSKARAKKAAKKVAAKKKTK